MVFWYTYVLPQTLGLRLSNQPLELLAARRRFCRTKHICWMRASTRYSVVLGGDLQKLSDFMNIQVKGDCIIFKKDFIR